MTHHEEKIAFIATGGGATCSYTVGAALALEEHGVVPDIFIGSSASAPIVTYFALGRMATVKSFWLNQVSRMQVLNPKTHRFDLDQFLELMKTTDPLTDKEWRSTTKQILIAVTDCKTMRPTYISNRDSYPWYEIIRASMAIPFFYNKKIRLGNDEYVDGDVAATITQHIRKVHALGATRIFIVDTSYQPLGRLTHLFSPHMLLRRESYVFVTARLSNALYRLWPYKAKNIHYIVARDAFIVDLFDNKTIDRGIACGYRDMKKILQDVALESGKTLSER